MEAEQRAKPTIPEVLPLITRFAKVPENNVGGCLHIVLDDGNVDDFSIQSCLDYAIKRSDFLAIEVAEVLLRMSKTQRLKLAGMFYRLSEHIDGVRLITARSAPGRSRIVNTMKE